MSLEKETFPSMSFSTKAYGKWILAGEHSVLRGVPALVFPLKSRFLDLGYKQSQERLRIQLSGQNGSELELLIWGVIERACQNLGLSRDQLQGELSIQSSVPVGAGMGASATICVALTRWLGFLGYVAESEFYEFARNLENLFHGESSGVDVAVALSGEALYFTRSGERTSFKPRWEPHWFVSYSGQRGVTADCVSKVKSLIARDAAEGSRLDAKMKAAVEQALNALTSEKSESAVRDLYDSVQAASECFHAWGLTEGELQRHMDELLEKGAKVVKPTGSGGGGFVLSIWESEPPKELKEKLISCR